MYLKLAHLVEKPSREYTPACDNRAAERAISDAKRKGPLLGGPVQVVRLPAFGLNHPLHPRFASRRPPTAGSQ